MAFEGIIPAVTTPFTADDQVDVPALKENIEKLIEAGVHGFVATGTMGEAGSLTREERALVVRSVLNPARCMARSRRVTCASVPGSIFSMIALTRRCSRVT